MEKNSYNGNGFAGTLTLIFVTLKLIGVINWSWVWVLAPAWISAIIITILEVIVFIASRR